VSAWQVLLADFGVVKNMGNRFHGKQAELGYADLFMGLAILAVMVAAAILLKRLTSNQERRRGYHNPRALLRELCRAHGLDRPSQRLLKRLAHEQHLAEPARLFVEAERFEPERLGRLSPSAEQFRQLRERLFAEPQADEPTLELAAPSQSA
jgi:hypothetical protein